MFFEGGGVDVNKHLHGLIGARDAELNFFVCFKLLHGRSCQKGIANNVHLEYRLQSLEEKQLAFRQLRVRRALTLLKDVLLRTRRALSLYKVYGNSALLVLNGTSLNIDSALLVLYKKH